MNSNAQRTPIDRDACTGEILARIQASNEMVTGEDGIGFIGSTTLYVEVYCEGDLLVHPHGFPIPNSSDEGLEARAFLAKVIEAGSIDRSKWNVIRRASYLMEAYS